MSWRTAVRVAGGVLIGLGLGTLPFLRYGAPHHHDRRAEHAGAPAGLADQGGAAAARAGRGHMHAH